MVKQYIAYGQIAPDDFIKELLEEGYKEEEITTELLETLLYYEWLDTKE